MEDDRDSWWPSDTNSQTGGSGSIMDQHRNPDSKIQQYAVYGAYAVLALYLVYIYLGPIALVGAVIAGFTYLYTEIIDSSMANRMMTNKMKNSKVEPKPLLGPKHE